MKYWKTTLLIFIVLLLAGGSFYFQKKQEAKYIGLPIIPERTEDIPLFSGLKPDSPVYVSRGDQWEDIMHFYDKELPENGWNLVMMQASTNRSEDGAGFISYWEKESTPWLLSVNASYYRNLNQTEVVFDKTIRGNEDPWIDGEVLQICINEQPDRSEDCFKLTDSQTIDRIGSMIDGALNVEKQQIYYKDKSVIDFGSMAIDVYYDLEKGIYFVSEKGAKWMKPEREFFELTRISKEY